MGFVCWPGRYPVATTSFSHLGIRPASRLKVSSNAYQLARQMTGPGLTNVFGVFDHFEWAIFWPDSNSDVASFDVGQRHLPVNDDQTSVFQKFHLSHICRMSAAESYIQYESFVKSLIGWLLLILSSPRCKTFHVNVSLYKSLEREPLSRSRPGRHRLKRSRCPCHRRKRNPPGPRTGTWPPTGRRRGPCQTWRHSGQRLSHTRRRCRKRRMLGR